MKISGDLEKWFLSRICCYHGCRDEDDSRVHTSSDDSDSNGSHGEENGTKKFSDSKEGITKRTLTGSRHDNNDMDLSIESKPDDEAKAGLKTVVFEEGAIGMQLEPTADDRACMVCDFLDAGSGKPSPARTSGLIEVGDVIVSVNGVTMESYEETIAILKAGGRREITFRPGREEDKYEGDNLSTDDDDNKERRKREKKAKKESKKDSRKEKKAKKEKQAKKESKRRD